MYSAKLMAIKYRGGVFPLHESRKRRKQVGRVGVQMGFDSGSDLSYMTTNVYRQIKDFVSKDHLKNCFKSTQCSKFFSLFNIWIVGSLLSIGFLTIYVMKVFYWGFFYNDIILEFIFNFSRVVVELFLKQSFYVALKHPMIHHLLYDIVGYQCSNQDV